MTKRNPYYPVLVFDPDAPDYPPDGWFKIAGSAQIIKLCPQGRDRFTPDEIGAIEDAIDYFATRAYKLQQSSPLVSKQCERHAARLSGLLKGGKG